MNSAPNYNVSRACHTIAPGEAEGPALVSADDICFYLCDPSTGQVIEEGHALYGLSVANKVLVFPGGKGSSVVQTDGLYQLALHHNAPAALVIENPDTVLVASCIILEIPLVDRVDAAFYQDVHAGMPLKVEANQGRIRYDI
ncbi:MAG: hypothetical protein C7B44_14020 [Sulfobacillus thermosulfidooxidans]|uniref:Phosphomevalonate dehydratase small subunit-like domain-containing protein n=1 Tax=Sulfobacillus thermotolerans TaxID=338644 RepID=A0ABN5H124_9FIRM|nr:hypothetical protein BXT84_10370 [Sulfobacillus thermotolerans]MCY0909611.1 DUF126 domain-containing protein [Sulfobacillus thermotolerans]PSR34342.1 MAG: hypothetical protein C7B44_14020 [Sulfobacillus thermosulfidooxidans]